MFKVKGCGLRITFAIQATQHTGRKRQIPKGKVGRNEKVNTSENVHGH